MYLLSRNEIQQPQLFFHGFSLTPWHTFGFFWLKILSQTKTTWRHREVATCRRFKEAGPVGKGIAGLRGGEVFRSYLRSTDVVMSSEKSDLGVMSDSGLGVYGLPYLGIFGSTYFVMSSEKIGPGKV